MEKIFGIGNLVKMEKYDMLKALNNDDLFFCLLFIYASKYLIENYIFYLFKLFFSHKTPINIVLILLVYIVFKTSNLTDSVLTGC